ncbi:hypothetical protein BGZ76_003126 [Entomortierella beljakovae]|nr:hypothetical protein BGZ76_003126 [Entomortierella beljakovae]
MGILPVLPLLAAAAAAHRNEHIEKRSQPSVPPPTLVDLKPLTWSDVNIIQPPTNKFGDFQERKLATLSVLNTNWTSNIFFNDGSTNKTPVMRYRFLFNFNDSSNNTIIEPSSTIVTLPWFKDSLRGNVDLYVIARHVPVRWAEATTVVNAIRAAQPSKPIVVLSGHLHVRDFKQYDGRAVGLSSGNIM